MRGRQCSSRDSPFRDGRGRREQMRNVLGRRTGLESDDNYVQQHAGAAHVDRSVGIGRERNVDSGGQSRHIKEG